MNSENVCDNCGAKVRAGAKFCHACGTPMAPAAGGGIPKFVWILASLVVAVLLVAVGYQAGRSSGEPPSGPAPTAGGAPQGAMPDLASMTPREQADRLFNRIMTAHQNGDMGEINMFKPMALQVYAMLGPLDPDAHYHVGLIHSITSGSDSAAARADSIEAAVPNHLLAIMLRTSVARLAGDTAAERRLQRRFLDNYEAQTATARQEYLDHQRAIEGYLAQARQDLGVAGGG
jgi:hypothetical protein